MHIRFLIFAIVFAWVSAWAVPVIAQDELAYQKRGNRYEGVRPKPVSGYDIELLSVRIDSREQNTTQPDRLHVRFFLTKPTQVYLTVRELDYKYYYLLDKIDPMAPWKAGFGNVFEWPTKDVIGHLQDLRIQDLGVVVRLEREQPSGVENVAPAVFYESRFPASVTGYAFTFRLRDDARATSAVFRQGGVDPVDKQTFPHINGGRPFTVQWNVSATAAPRGPYKFVLKGYFLDTNDPVSQTVSFYHSPVIGDR